MNEKRITNSSLCFFLLLFASTAFCAIKLPMPVIIPSDTVFMGNMTAHINIPDSSYVFYSLDGSVPTDLPSMSSKSYAPGFGISIDSELTLNAIAFPKNPTDTSLLPSDMASAKFTKRLSPPYVTNQYGWQIPPDYYDSVTIILHSFEPADIYYTTDSTTPTTNSTLYTQPLTFKQSVFIQAIAVKPGRLTSYVSQFNFINRALSITSNNWRKQAEKSGIGKLNYYLVSGRKVNSNTRLRTFQRVITGK